VSGHIDQLDKILTRDPAASGADAKLVLSRVLSEINDRQITASVTSSDFFFGVLKSLSRIRGDSNNALRMACLWECGKFFDMHALYGPAIEVAAQLESLARRSNDTVWFRKSQTLAGILHAEFGDVVEALTKHAKSFELAVAESGSVHVIVLANMSVALLYAGLYHEAIQCCHRAVEISNTGTDRVAYESGAVAYCNMAAGHLYLEQYQAGLDAIRKSLERSAEPTDGRSSLSRTIREWNFVQLALEVGLIHEASQHAAACERYGKWGSNPRGTGLSALARGLCEVHSGNAAAGLQILEGVLIKAGENNTSAGSLREDAQRSLIRAYEKVGQPQNALPHLTALIQEMRARRQRSLGALFSWQRGIHLEVDNDSRPLEFKEAKLRARVAEMEVENSRLEMLERLAITADLKEESSGAHGYRVGKLASLMANELRWERERCNAMESAARLHDIGKIGVPDRILLTSQQLKDAERRLMSHHAVVGAELLAQSDIPQLRMAEDIARYHHEWWDGSGYPAKLVGKRIPIHARIVALADVFDALTHGRPYAPAWPIEKALEEIQARRGTQFDPELTDRFIELVHRLQKEHPDLDEYLGRAGRNSPFAQARNRIRLMLEEGRERVEKQVAPASQTVH
jgi:response regulator RpfG family c-di-GMP phosphodiesterase